MKVAPADKATFQELEDWDVAMEARYIVTGPGHEFTPEVCAALCSNLEHLVGSALTRMGMHVRPLRML